MMIQILLAAIPVIFTIAFFVLSDKINKKNKLRIGKILVVALVVAYIPRTITLDSFSTFWSHQLVFGSKQHDVLILLLRWAYYFSLPVFVISIFWNVTFFKKIITYISLPVSVLAIIFVSDLLFPLGFSLEELGISGVFYVIEISLYFLFALYSTFILKSELRVTWKSVLQKSWILLFMLLYMMPFETLSRFFGTTDIEVGIMTPYHKYWFYLTMIILALIYIVLKRYSKRAILITLLYMSLGLAFQYMAYYRGRDFDLGSIPIQLCNLGSVITFFAVATKHRKLFYFTYLVNVMGALMTFVFPDVSGYLLAYYPLHFSFEHMFLLMIPILTVALGLMPRVRKSELKSALIAFSIYFVFTWVLGTVIRGYTDETPNFFFLFDDYIAEILAFAYKLRAVEVTIGDMVLWPLYQIGIGLGFLIAIWLLLLGYKWIYKTIDEIEMLIDYRNNRRIEVRKMNQNKKDIQEEVVLKIKNFSKKYDKSDVFAVEGLNLEVRAGEVFGFLGTNGAGKSTSIKSIVGILPITEGDIEVCGHSIKNAPIEAKSNIGYVPDNHAVYERLTGKEYINHIADLYGVPVKEREELFNRFVKMFNLDRSIDQQIKSYSHGMKQKVAVIAALIHRPKLWILDEPLTGLDPESTYEIKQYMREHTSNGNTVFFSSHILDVVEKLCDRVAIIKDGKVMGILDMNEIEKGKDSLEKIFLSTVKG